jgi:chitodextrinase
VVPVTVSNTVAGPPTAGLVGYWNFDEGSGVIAHDTSGSGYNGVVNGATWTAGKINSSLSFNGSTNSVVTPNIALGSAFSVSAWVNSAVAYQSYYARIAETQYSSGFYLGVTPAGSRYKFIVNGGVGSTGSCGVTYGCAEGGLVTMGWHLVTATFDGAAAKLYVDNALVASDTFTAPLSTNLPLYIGQYYGGSAYGWNGAIDEVRLYNRAITGAEVSAIYSYTGGASDTTPPSTPANVSATGVSASQINVSWSASTDNVGVTGYRVFRNGGMAGTVTTLSYSDSGLAASTTYSYTVVAFDAAGNSSTPSLAATATTLSAPDTTPPTVSITTPIANATVSNTITVAATANDNVAVGDVQFQLDGVNLGADLTAPPYSISWNTTTAGNGSHTLTAIARDTSNNAATSAVVPVTVSNTVAGPPTAGLVGYWNFDEGSGVIAHDTSGSGYNGVVNGATWTAGKINSGLSFNGTSAVVTPNIALGNTFSVSAWVNPAAVVQGTWARIAETQYSPGFYLGTNEYGIRYKFIVNGAAGSTGTCFANYGCVEGGTVTSGWHLVTATFDGTTARLYVDSVLAASDTFTAPPNANLPLYIGRYYGASAYGWNGAIDEVCLYNRALTDADVSAIYTSTGVAPDTTPPSVSITSPLANTTVSNTITVTATASDNVAVGDVQFQLDGVNLGADLTTAPYSISWNTATASNGSHNLTAIARDTSHNAATSAAVEVTVSNTVTQPPIAGLIGYWNFDEGSGVIAHDTSGSGYNGAISGASWITGKSNSGLSFIGTSGVVTPNITLGNTFSVSAWVNPAAVVQGAWARIAETQYSSGFYLGANEYGVRYKFIVNGAAGSTGTCGANYGCVEGGTVTSGWHLVTATFDGTTARLYVDSVLAASDTFTAPPNTNLPLYIGRYYGASAYGWIGALDEVRIYNRALSSAEVIALFN